MKRSIKIAVSLLMILVMVSVTAYAAGVIRDVKGKENPNISVTYNGVKQTLRDGNGNVVYPVIINGSTYLPVRAIATTMGAQITWDGATQTVNIVGSGSNDGAVPTDLPPTNPTPSAPPTQPTPPATTGTSTNAGTLEDPVEYGKSFTWSEQYDDASFGFKSNVTMRITNVKPITIAQLNAIGLRAEEDSRIEYLRVSVDMRGKNVTPTITGKDYLYVTLTQPDVWGSQSTSGLYIIGGYDINFEGSVLENLYNRYTGDNMEIKKGSSLSEVNYSGDIILPVVKGETNYLVMQKANDELDTNARKIFFKLN